MKECITCHQSKELTNFYGKSSECKTCAKTRTKKWKSNNREKYLHQRRKKWTEEKYNLTSEEFDFIFQKQNGSCAICHTKNIKLCVDHNHNTNKNRGLLCKKCNCAIGLLQENPLFLQSAIDYLNSFTSK
jgi:hypothetical protein